MKMYPKIKAKHNLYGDEGFVDGEEVWIQEKLDGSNFSFYKNEDGKLRFFSRNQEVFETDDSPFNNLVKELLEHFEKYDETISMLSQHLYICEYLKMGKIKYKDNYKDEIERLVGIDLLSVHDMDEWMKSEDHRKIGRPSNPLKYYFGNLKLNWVDNIVKGELGGVFNLDAILNLANRQSYLNPDSKAEGIVVKSLTKTMKVVNPDFSEMLRDPKTKKGTIEYDKYMPLPRIRKYVNRLIEDGKLKQDWTNEDYNIIFKNINLFTEDIWEEEQEDIKKMMFKQMNKQASKEISNVLKEGLLNSNYNISDYSYNDFVKGKK